MTQQGRPPIPIRIQPAFHHSQPLQPQAQSQQMQPNLQMQQIPPLNQHQLNQSFQFQTPQPPTNIPQIQQQLQEQQEITQPQQLRNQLPLNLNQVLRLPQQPASLIQDLPQFPIQQTQLFQPIQSINQLASAPTQLQMQSTTMPLHPQPVLPFPTPLPMF